MGHHQENRRQDTVAAIATAGGQAGIGIVRVSGPGAALIAERVLGQLPPPRRAVLRTFRAAAGDALDEGIAIFFPAPHSYTGEDTLELQGHGSPVLLGLLLDEVCRHGAREAEPGEFTRRAFLNGRLDLAQAEAVADLIAATTASAARAASRTVQGEFSAVLARLDERLADLRAFVEAAIDFPDEEVDFLAESDVALRLQRLVDDLKALKASAARGAQLTDGVRVVLVGEPNVGKSSLLNRLARADVAIVTPVAGTTRDLIRQSINLDGVPLHLVDTAGLRQAEDAAEREGVRRTLVALGEADVVVEMIDDERSGREKTPFSARQVPLIQVRNKIDLSGRPAGLVNDEPLPGNVSCAVRLSALTGEGMEAFTQALKSVLSLQGNLSGDFSARRRHLAALDEVLAAVQQASTTLAESGAGELVAEDLRSAQQALAKIVGEKDNEELLGRIFAKFCIGK